jgi:cytochrome oxidase Cu insertion factor (SCO1/SenC/PrrC family)
MVESPFASVFSQKAALITDASSRTDPPVTAHQRNVLMFKLNKFRLVRALVFVLAAQTAVVHATETLKEFLKINKMDASYVVTYKDAHGKVISSAEFAKQALAHGTYTVTKDETHHTATASVMSAEEVAKIEARAEKREQAQIKPGQALPPFHLTDLKGLKVDNASLQGHTTLINFFFSTCAPCVQEIPVLNEFMRRHPKQKVLAVTFDDADTARQFVAERKFAWPIVADAQSFIDQLSIIGDPTLALVGPDGKLRKISFSPLITKKMKPLSVADLERWAEVH